MSSDYVAPRYWAEVYEDAYDESAVGYPYLARSINQARYDVERRNVARALAAAAVPAVERVLDVGAGTGIWIEFWRGRRVREIVGVDLTDAAVTRLRSHYPEHDFIRCDIGDVDPPLPREVDVVSAMSVLLHITDEGRFERALLNVLRSVRVGGHVVLVEPVIVHRWWGPPFGPEANSRARPLAVYARILERAGFAIVDSRPNTCLLANVIDTRSRFTFRLLDVYWRILVRVVGRHERRGRLVGGMLRAIDLVATLITPNGPSSKVIVAKRTAAAPIVPA